MALILNIETATVLCSVALSKNGKILLQREIAEEKSHAGSLSVFIQDILKEAEITVNDLSAVAVGKGPGSYTGLRIGVSVAKGICYGSGVPLIAVSTLHVLFSDAMQKIRDHAMIYCPMIDARRMEVFCCLLDGAGKEILPVSAMIIGDDSFKSYLSHHRLVFFGPGMEKCRKVLVHNNAVFLPDVLPHASAMAVLSEEKFEKGLFEDIAYFEPFYLKDFVATVPKKRLII